MRGWLLLCVVTGTACAEAPPAAPADAAASDAAPQEEVARARPPHLARVADTRPSGFPHEPHTGFECTRCHEAVPGHGAHAQLACHECHDAPAPAARPSGDCSSCHHSSAVVRGCADCHEGKNAPAAAQQVQVTRDRTLPFAHARHNELECTRCHERSGDRVAGACTSCHERHHRADANCRGCHRAVPAAAHPVARVHQGCGGAGCHTDATVAALPFSRSLCVVCHTAQAGHEPDEECTGCHRLQGVLP